MERFTDKTAVVTGGGSGIGRADRTRRNARLFSRDFKSRKPCFVAELCKRSNAVCGVRGIDS